MTKQRAFAAVKMIEGRPYINFYSVRPLASQVRASSPQHSFESWKEMKYRGWRVRPVVISLEEDSNDQ